MESDEGQQKRFYALRTTIGQERNVASMIYSRIPKLEVGISSILVTPELRGYIVLESVDQTEIEKSLPGISHVRGIVSGEMKIDEIERFLEPVSTVAKAFQLLPRLSWVM
jgi:transcriptional antiterminator NusG